MPVIAFASNFIWVMVIALLGPSLPAMIADLGMSYGQAGFLFTLLSMGSLFGTTVGATASDYINRKLLYGGCALVLALGLLSLGFATGYAGIAVLVFLLSLFGSPIGAIGQSIMLDMFPDRRERNLSLQTFFAAAGSFLAPLIVSLNYSVGLSWKWPFIETALLAIGLCAAIFLSPIPSSRGGSKRPGILPLLRNTKVLSVATLIFLSVAIDLGFSFWLAEYFKAELHAPLRLSSAVVGFYLAGIIAGRLAITALLKKLSVGRLLASGLTLALASILVFILAPPMPIKIVACVLYGLGVGPVFPLLMSIGVKQRPDGPGAVTGMLYAFLSLGGMVFPLLVGAIAAGAGIGLSYLFCAVLATVILVAVLASGMARKPAPAPKVAGD
jgi:MFS family permease